MAQPSSAQVAFAHDLGVTVEGKDARQLGNDIEAAQAQRARRRHLSTVPSRPKRTRPESWAANLSSFHRLEILRGRSPRDAVLVTLAYFDINECHVDKYPLEFLHELEELGFTAGSVGVYELWLEKEIPFHE